MLHIMMEHFAMDQFYQHCTFLFQGEESEESCNNLCLVEEDCMYAAWYKDNTCSRYSHVTCDLNNDPTHFTFKKIGTNSLLSVTMHNPSMPPTSSANVFHGISVLPLNNVQQVQCIP